MSLENLGLDEIVLLTHEWDSMRVWWAALLGVDPRPVGDRTVVIETAGLRVVIEHSDIAMNANPEVAGVISLTVSAHSATAALATHNRLVAISSATTAPRTTPAECACGTATPIAPTWQSACRSTPTRTTGVARRSIPTTS